MVPLIKNLHLLSLGSSLKFKYYFILLAIPHTLSELEDQLVTNDPTTGKKVDLPSSPSIVRTCPQY